MEINNIQKKGFHAARSKALPFHIRFFYNANPFQQTINLVSEVKAELE